jgi:hypothetical protein
LGVQAGIDARGQISLTQQFRTQAKLGGQWTGFGLAQALAVHRTWLYARIRTGRIPAVRHPVLGQYLIPDDPALSQTLTAQRQRCGYRWEGSLLTRSRPTYNTSRPRSP